MDTPYITIEDLWLWIDEQSNLIYRDFDDEGLCKSDHYKMMLVGRKDMIERLIDFIREREE